jgi:hypothetical protein
MKRILFLLLLISGTAYGQSQPTSSKTRFVNGLYMGTKLDSYFNTADSNALYWRADSVVMAKYKGTARALAFASALGSYKLIADTFFTSGYTTRARTKQVVDSLGNSITSNTGILWGDGTNVNGSLYTFLNDSVITFRGVKFLQNVSTTQFPSIYSTFIGYGAGANFMNGTKGYANTAIGYNAGAGLQSNVTSEASSNTLVGYESGAGLTTGTSNTALGTASLGSAPAVVKTIAIGWHSMINATDGDDIVAIGSQSLQSNTANSSHTAVGSNSLLNNTTGIRNTAVGYQSGGGITSGSYNTILGWNSMSSDANGDYNTVIGYSSSNNLFAGSNNTIIGARIVPGSVSNSIIIGNGNGTQKAYHNNSSWDMIDTVKALAFQSIGGITTGATSYIKGNSISMVMSNTGAGNFNTWQLLGGSSGTTYNWEFSKDNAVANSFEIAPSTAVGGTSFASSVFRIKNTGDVTITGSTTSNSFIKSGGTSTQALIADGSVQTLTSGIYTPTLTNTTNLSASSLSYATYTRIGNVVHVNIGLGLTPTLSATNTVLTVTLPFTAVNGTQNYVGSGTVFGNLASNLFASGMVNVTSTTQATFTFYSTALTASSANFQFQYILN